MKNLNILIVQGNLKEENQNFLKVGIQTHTESLKDSLNVFNKNYHFDVINPSSDQNLDKIKNKLLKYDGLIFSDDLTMLGAGEESCSEKARKSIQAGCDMVLVCNNRKEINGVINLFDELGIEPSERLSKMKKSTNIDWNELNNSDRKNNINIKLEKIRSQYEKNNNWSQ